MTNKPLQHLLVLIILSVWSGFSFATLSEITTYTYDSVNRLTQKVVTGNGISYTETLTYFANGQIQTKTEKLTDNGTDVQDIAVTYTYDKLGRLSKVTNTDPLLGNETVSYTYDKVGNRLSQTVNGTTTSYTYNANDQLLTAGAVTYTYDDNGNTLSKVEGANTTTYSYDKQNKLASVTENGTSTTFNYNPNGLRIGKKTAADEINYLIDEQSGFGDIVAEYENGTKTKTYTLGNRRVSQTVGSDTFYFGTDNQGSVKFLSNTTGLTDNYTYDSFGVLKNQSGTTDNSFRYTGEQFDELLGMYNLRARYYAPEIGRFTQQDSFQGIQKMPITLNKYLYTNANPISNSDPSGYLTMSLSLPSINLSSILYLGSISFMGYNLATNNSSSADGLRAIAHSMVRYEIETKADELSPADSIIASAAYAEDTGWHKHHSIPVYTCGAINQSPNFVPLKPVFHMALHSNLRLYAEFIDQIYGVTFDKRLSVFDHSSSNNRGGLRKLAGSKLGRTFIVNHLDAFYSTGWYSGNVYFKQRFMRESQLFINTAYRNSLPLCRR